MGKSLPEVQVVVAMAELRSSHTGLEEEVAAAAAAAVGVVTCLHLPQAHLQTACEEEMGIYRKITILIYGEIY